LTQREIADLLRKRIEIERGSNCPHGRPTTMRVSIEELEQRFGRR
jgi:DNA mismatch repair protein MutL